jgi:hypothetical protein
MIANKLIHHEISRLMRIIRSVVVVVKFSLFELPRWLSVLVGERIFTSQKMSRSGTKSE